jgi:hypothetical protein
VALGCSDRGAWGTEGGGEASAVCSVCCWEGCGVGTSVWEGGGGWKSSGVGTSVCSVWCNGRPIWEGSGVGTVWEGGGGKGSGVGTVWEGGGGKGGGVGTSVWEGGGGKGGGVGTSVWEGGGGKGGVWCSGREGPGSLESIGGGEPSAVG